MSRGLGGVGGATLSKRGLTVDAQEECTPVRHRHASAILSPCDGKETSCFESIQPLELRVLMKDLSQMIVVVGEDDSNNHLKIMQCA